MAHLRNASWVRPNSHLKLLSHYHHHLLFRFLWQRSPTFGCFKALPIWRLLVGARKLCLPCLYGRAWIISDPSKIHCFDEFDQGCHLRRSLSDGALKCLWSHYDLTRSEESRLLVHPWWLALVAWTRVAGLFLVFSCRQTSVQHQPDCYCLRKATKRTTRALGLAKRRVAPWGHFAAT